MIESLIRTVYFFETQGRKYGRNFKLVMHGGRIFLWRRPNAPSVALRGGMRFLRLAEFVRYNRAAIGGPSKR